MKDFTGYILAGGKSSRMGADKFALKIGGETFLERAVQTLKPACATVKIVLNQTQKKYRNKSRNPLRYSRKSRRTRRHSRGFYELRNEICGNFSG